MILVTAAGGKSARAVMRALIAKGASVRALVHRPERAPEMQALGAEAAVGDLRDQAALERALAGCRAVYHICPAMQPDEEAIGRRVIAAAQAAGIEHFVFHSVMHPQLDALPHHTLKLHVETALIKSGLPYTILQPAPYMQNLLESWERIARDGVYTTTYGLTSRMSLVDLDDVAVVAAMVLTEPGHLYATYELAGPAPFTAAEMAAALSAALGRPATAQALDVAQWETRMRAAGMPDYAVTTLATMFRYYAACGFTGNPHVLGWLLGRQPTDFAAFLARVRQEKAL